MPAKAGRKAKPLSQNLDELEQKLIDLANAQREEDDVKGEEKESLLTKEGKAERKKKIKEITNKKGILTRAINDIRNRLKRQTTEQKSQAIIDQVNQKLDQINQNPKVDIQITKSRLQKLKEFLGIGQQTEQKEQDPTQTPPSGQRSPGRMSPSGTPEAPVSQASSIVPSGMATPEEEEEPIQYAPVGDISREQKEQFDKEDTVKRLVDGALIGAVIELQSESNLTDNVNKAEEQGSNTQIITPEYLLRERPRKPILVEMKGNIPPTPQPQVNELLNSEVETVPNVTEINPNQTGRLEADSRDYQSRPNFTFGQSSDFDRNKQRQEVNKKFIASEQSEVSIKDDLGNYARTKNALNNSSSSSSNPDNTNYENSTEDKQNQLLQEAQRLGMTDDFINDVTNMDADGINNLYDEYVNTVPTQEQQPTDRADILSGIRPWSGRGMLSGLEESPLNQRLGQIGAGAQAGAIAGARQGMQRGGLRQGLEGGLEGGLRGGVAAGVAGSFGGGLAGEFAQMGAQEAITDILGRIRRLGAGDDQPDGGVDIKTQIDNINQELSAIKDPLKYPEFKEKEIYRFPGPGEQKKGVQLVQNSVTEYLNDVNLYGGGHEYEPVLDL